MRVWAITSNRVTCGRANQIRPLPILEVDTLFDTLTGRLPEPR